MAVACGGGTQELKLGERPLVLTIINDNPVLDALVLRYEEVVQLAIGHPIRIVEYARSLFGRAGSESRVLTASNGSGQLLQVVEAIDDTVAVQRVKGVRRNLEPPIRFHEILGIDPDKARFTAVEGRTRIPVAHGMVEVIGFARLHRETRLYANDE